MLLGLVRSQVAPVLGNISPDEIDSEVPFRDLGFDSVKATELIDRLKNVTALALPPTLAFDHPTPNALATHLGHLLGGSVAALIRARSASESTRMQSLALRARMPRVLPGIRLLERDPRWRFLVLRSSTRTISFPRGPWE